MGRLTSLRRRQRSVLALDVAFDTFIAGGAFTPSAGGQRLPGEDRRGATFEALASDVTVAEGSSGAWTLQVPVTIGSRVGFACQRALGACRQHGSAADGAVTPASGTATIPGPGVVTYLAIEVRWRQQARAGSGACSSCSSTIRSGRT